MKIFITGGTGFIGSHTARALLDIGCDVTVTRFGEWDRPDFLSRDVDRLSIVDLNLNDVDATCAALREARPDNILHLAVPARFGLAPIEEMALSFNATIGLMSAALQARVPHVTIASSLVVYRGIDPNTGPFNETALVPLAATNPLEADKRLDEVVAAFLTHSKAVKVIRARLGVTWGPLYQSMLNAPSRLARLALGRYDVDVSASTPDPRDAHPDDHYDLLYVRDCAKALAALLTQPTLRHEVYNVGSGRMTRYADLVTAICRAAGVPDIPLNVVQRPAINAPLGYMDPSRLCEETGFRPAYDLDAAAHDYVDWLRNHKA
ncbi:NAD(P)-dependent oxidoreductase [Bosea caraganae]|uniref:UDP-glucose 4-epimerase n=1 Tax=Bosea caraganae TaxID=2763117 RepID=A0A370KZ70_9HYPH|nr:NAD(P)-dependent oxidoreductase [Bosea caraganae]RDJ20299.1 NAD(P)-dependent oxidoreductase [Bosea caraganae]RDJ23996.1 NAD(P)-dependent oxidoreductase [Bosea caraganae]